MRNKTVIIGIVLLLVSCAGNSESRERIGPLSRVETVSPDHLFLPVGYYPFHENQLFNYNLNRWHSMGYARYRDMEEAGSRIKSVEDWKVVMLDLARKAEAEHRTVNAAFYYRAAEFFLKHVNSEKDLLYDKFITLFYRAFAGKGIVRYRVPYNGSFLPAYRLHFGGTIRKGVVVIHGGFDSFKEEFYSMAKRIADNGYDVIVFEGPGQGSAVKKHGLYFDFEWEKPVGAILDYFKLDQVTLIGISLGGYLAIRAAAFEPRVKRVIASSVAFDHGKLTSFFEQQLVKILFACCREYTNRSVLEQMKEDRMVSWSIGNMMYIANKKRPIEALDVMLSLNEKNLHSERVKQDVLILTGKDDHLIPYKMHRKQIDALVNARSVTGRVFTKKEHAGNHCQVGNLGLAIDTMVEWIERMSEPNRAPEQRYADGKIPF